MDKNKCSICGEVIEDDDLATCDICDEFFHKDSCGLIQHSPPCDAAFCDECLDDCW